MLKQIKLTFPQGNKAPVTVDLLDFVLNSSGSGNLRSIDLPNGGGVANVDITKYSAETVEVEEAPAVEPAPAVESNEEGAPTPLGVAGVGKTSKPKEGGKK